MLHSALLLSLALLQSPTTAPATPPTTSPATTRSAPTTRPRLTVPPGHVRMNIDGRHFILRPDDEAFIRATLPTVPPTTRPSTLPVDLLNTLRERTDEIATLLAADLDISPDATRAFLNDRLIAALADFDTSPVESVLFITSRPRLAELLKTGWENPSVRLNRGTGDAEFSQILVIPTDPDSIDAVVPILLPETIPPDPAARAAKFIADVESLDSSIIRARAQRGQFILQATLVRFIGNETLGQLKLPADQEWLASGITGALTAKYTSLISGLPRRAIVYAMVYEPPQGRTPPGYIRTAGINLLSPVNPVDLRPQALLPYADALRRKSVAAVDELILRHGDQVLPKLLDALRSPQPPATTRPATGPELVQLIQDLTGTDVTPFLR